MNDKPVKLYKFKSYPDGYKCNQPGNNSGEYISVIEYENMESRAELAESKCDNMQTQLDELQKRVNQLTSECDKLSQEMNEYAAENDNLIDLIPIDGYGIPMTAIYVKKIASDRDAAIECLKNLVYSKTELGIILPEPTQKELARRESAYKNARAFLTSVNVINSQKTSLT